MAPPSFITLLLAKLSSTFSQPVGHVFGPLSPRLATGGGTAAIFIHGQFAQVKNVIECFLVRLWPWFTVCRRIECDLEFLCQTPQLSDVVRHFQLQGPRIRETHKEIKSIVNKIGDLSRPNQLSTMVGSEIWSVSTRYQHQLSCYTVNIVRKTLKPSNRDRGERSIGVSARLLQHTSTPCRNLAQSQRQGGG